MFSDAALAPNRLCHRVARRRAPAYWAAAAIGALPGCGATSVETSIELASQRAEIIGADGATAYTGIANLENLQGGGTCSAALIAPTLVLTTKHCVFVSTSSGDMPLPVEGFRVGFGPTADTAVQRNVDDVEWIGKPDELAVEPAVLAGEDVAVLHLNEPAPTGETVRDFALVFTPIDQQPVHLAGFGVTNVQTGVSGVRAVGAAKITGFDPTTGIIQTSGDSACFGDSGGPVLSDDFAVVLGVIGQVAGRDGSFCGEGMSFAATAANVRVQRLVAKACAGVGGCGPGAIREPNGGGALSDVDAGGGEIADDALLDADTAVSSIDADTREASNASSSGCACGLDRARAVDRWPVVIAAIFIGSVAAKRMTRRCAVHAPRLIRQRLRNGDARPYEVGHLVSQDPNALAVRAVAIATCFYPACEIDEEVRC